MNNFNNSGRKKKWFFCARVGGVDNVINIIIIINKFGVVCDEPMRDFSIKSCLSLCTVMVIVWTRH